MKADIILTSNAEYFSKSLFLNSKFCVHLLQNNKDGQKKFPDGELYINLGKLHGKKAIVIFSGAPSPNDSLLELEFILNLLKERKISVELFVTFFPYARQDCVFQPGEINIAETLIKNWTRVYKVKKIWVVDAHFKGRDWVKKYPIKNISAVDVLKQAVLKKYPDIFLISPDSGAKRRSGLPGFKKKRKNSYEVKLTRDKNLAKAINGKVVGVFDDMIETGGTMVKACQKCRELGAKKVIAIATHGVMQSGVDRITKTFDELFLTNTINCASANVDVSDLIIRLSQKP